jgi:4-phytase/acid phosphatase/peptide/nickel transport system substrate-binding protein
MKSGFFQRMCALSFLRGGFLTCAVLTATIGVCAQVSYADPKYGGSLHVADEIDAAGFDAIKTRTLAGIGGMAGNLVMERLFEMDKDSRLIPVLGLSATPSADGKTWTIRLRQGVSFHDGTPFNADAVVHHWQRILNLENRFVGLILLRPITSVEKTGDHEVRFNLAHPWLSFTASLASPHGLAALIPSPKAVADDVQNRAPVGTGPFVFKEWKSGDRIILARNPHYRQAGKPYLDEIVLRAIPDHETRYAASVSGQLDLMITDRPNHVKSLTENPKIAAILREPAGAYILALNTLKPPLNDARVRRALAHAWDQEKFLKASYKNIMKYTENWYGDALSCDETGYLHPDLEKAKALIAEYGKPVEVTYLHSPTNRGRETGEMLQQMLKPIGVGVTLAPADWAAITKQIFSKEYDIATWGIHGSDEIEPYTMAAFHSESPWNVTRYANEEVDKQLLALRTSMDPVERKAAFCSIARQINHDAPFLYLCAPIHYAFARTDLKNLPKWRYGFLHLADIWMDR